MTPQQLYLKLAKAISEAPSIPACQTSDPEAWFVDVGQNYTTNHEQRWAIKMCNQCPVQKECAEYAIAAEEIYGLWGGLTPRQRQLMRNKGRFGRPKSDNPLLKDDDLNLSNA